MADFSKLENFSMFTPSDMIGGAQLNLGGSLSQTNVGFATLLRILENNGRGVLNAADLKTALTSLSPSELGGVDLSQFISFYSTQGFIDALGPGTALSKLYNDAKGQPQSVSGMQEILGSKFTIPSGVDLTIVLSKSPFFNPSTRNTKISETFLNSMPTIVLSQMVPYLQVEFNVPREVSNQLQAPGLLKFLLGAVDKSSLGPGNTAMLQGHEIEGAPATDQTPQIQELDYAGMELFTSPQTLVNPQPNLHVSSDGTRYVDVLDPYRPFATLEHVTVTAAPAGAGFYTYKKAQMTIKIHDRSRLAEISDLIRPRVYSGVTVWLTYGWRAPRVPGLDPYCDYINNNMMMREAYGIINSNFTFDNVGQVTLNLELFTKGVSELRDIKISDNDQSAKKLLNDLKRTIEDISRFRQVLKLDPPVGLNKEVRTFQLLDAAETGTFPDWSASDINTQITTLKKSLTGKAGIDQTALTGLITSLQKLYKPANNDATTKFAWQQAFNTTVTATIKAMFDECRSGPDPFLPTSAKGATVNSTLAKVIDDANKAPTTTVQTTNHAVVSFGKLFSVFALRGILSSGIADEVQVFFYNMNESCGPISSHSVAEFPIDLAIFFDQYRQQVVSKNSEQITLEEFLQLVINAQFLDNRAIGYGFRSFYEPYDPKNRDAQTKKDRPNAYENALAAYTALNGPFKMPVIEMYVEMSHERVSEVGESDILQLLNYSSKDAASVKLQDSQGKGARKILRIHLYDKQTNPNAAVGRLLKNATNTGFLQLKPTDMAAQRAWTKLFPAFTAAAQEAAAINQLQEDAKSGNVLLTVASNQQIKDIVSQLVPTIRFGANGTTVSQANLASKADPLLSSVQMIRSMTVKNNASPNGAGEGGIPLRVIPAQLTLNSMGNPLATMAQQYFIDFQTGTTLDNLYIVIGLTHSFAPGKFETAWTFGYSDAYGVFEGAPTTVAAAAQLNPNVAGTG